MFEGVSVAMVTPFTDTGEVDDGALRRLVDELIEAGVAALVPCGTTGEAATLTTEEHIAVIGQVVEHARGRVPVLAGTGSNATAEAVHLTRSAADTGADGALVVTPYYNKPTQDGLERHFLHIAESTDIPIVLYNVPSRTGVSLQPETVTRIAAHPRVVGIKEASGALEMMTLLRRLCRLTILSGEDHLILPSLAVGAAGVVSVAANVVPRECVRLVELFQKGECTAALELHERLFPIFRALFLETNPIPVKTALKLMGRGNARLRLPLTPMSRPHVEALRGVLSEAGLVS